MLSEKEAFDLALRRIKSMDVGMELMIIESETLTYSFGWIFFYCARKLIETGDFMEYGLVGNAPILVDKHKHKIIPTGTAHAPEYYAELYEKQGFIY